MLRFASRGAWFATAGRRAACQAPPLQGFKLSMMSWNRIASRATPLRALSSSSSPSPTDNLDPSSSSSPPPPSSSRPSTTRAANGSSSSSNRGGGSGVQWPPKRSELLARMGDQHDPYDECVENPIMDTEGRGMGRFTPYEDESEYLHDSERAGLSPHHEGNEDVYAAGDRFDAMYRGASGPDSQTLSEVDWVSKMAQQQGASSNDAGDTGGDADRSATLASVCPDTTPDSCTDKGSTDHSANGQSPASPFSSPPPPSSSSSSSSQSSSSRRAYHTGGTKPTRPTHTHTRTHTRTPACLASYADTTATDEHTHTTRRVQGASKGVHGTRSFTTTTTHTGAHTCVSDGGAGKGDGGVVGEGSEGVRVGGGGGDEGRGAEGDAHTLTEAASTSPSLSPSTPAAAAAADDDDNGDPSADTHAAADAHAETETDDAARGSVDVKPLLAPPPSNDTNVTTNPVTWTWARPPASRGEAMQRQLQGVGAKEMYDILVLPRTMLAESEIVRAVEALGGMDVKVVPTRGKGGLDCDGLIFVSGRSGPHLRRMADVLVTALKRRKLTEAPGMTGAEGYDTDDWVIVDCWNWIVNIMEPSQRKALDLESHWSVKEFDQVLRANGGEDEKQWEKEHEKFVDKFPLPEEYAPFRDDDSMKEREMRRVLKLGRRGRTRPRGRASTRV